jgi:hypothetical protein
MSAPYKDIAIASLPRVLALFNDNNISPMLGVGDRYHWSWKGSDFANGTFQGAVHGLACLAAHDLLPDEISKTKILTKIKRAIDGVRKITYRNGSLDEILPFESSYCVTSLVAFDILCAVDTLKDHISKSDISRHVETVRPLIKFIVSHKETHGVITNHLAVSLAALGRWQIMTRENVQETINEVLEQILSHYSNEGWFLEYSGADFGYQTLALDYLVDFNALFPDSDLGKPLEKALTFLSYGAHPDGSFGGTYGSRNTRFLYPAGIEIMAHDFEGAIPLARFSREAHKKNTVVGLPAMDEPNFITMFNSVCRAAAIANKLPTRGKLPHQLSKINAQFPDAGLIIVGSQNNYNIINWKKGGSFYSSTQGKSGGLIASGKEGKIYTSQSGLTGKLVSATDDEIIIEGQLERFQSLYPTPGKMIILRLLCLTLMRINSLNKIIKKLLVKLLIQKSSSPKAIAQRKISLLDNTIEDVWIDNPHGLNFLEQQDFYAIHMASQGYWQVGDDA